MYANKKITINGNLAQQTAKIISNVVALETKNVIRLADDTVYLPSQIWKDQVSALNWICCLQRFYLVKRNHKTSANLYFKDIESEQLIGTMINNQPKVLIFG